ncbi:alpha/beta fold hydrolase [Patiriisocius hiemis]|uniref:alpha/beta fold hydrolase n=1 Tax=Patiriisocius hiemis TaxID=3075604 RepID=UPI003D779108
MIETLNIPYYKTRNGARYQSIPLSYQVFGQPIGEAPIVLVNHALTGNSNVTGANGWWRQIIGENQIIDTANYTVLSFNVPGNGYDGFVIENYKDFEIYDITKLFLKGLEILKIKSLFAVIGGSLGGCIAWQMAVLRPKLIEHLIPIASDWKATDWLIAQCRVQKQILNNSITPIEDARAHAMTFYRTPQSLSSKFNRSINENLYLYNVESWLLHHGERLSKRFKLASYKLLNHLLTTHNIARETGNFLASVKEIESDIHLVGIDTDGFYVNSEIVTAYEVLQLVKSNVSYYKIASIHGHDAFLIEYNQLRKILAMVFNNKTIKKQKYEYANT